MSMFLPEGSSEPKRDGVSSATPASPSVSDEDFDLMQRVFKAAASRPLMIPDALMAYIIDYIQTSNLDITIGQIFGSGVKFNQTIVDAVAAMFKAHIATTETEVNITSSSLATFSGAPSISGLEDGHYTVLFGTSGNGDAAGSGSSLNIAARVNGSSNTNVAESQAQAIHVSIARADVVTLNAGGTSNTLELFAQTNIAGHTSVVRHSWLMCLKYADL